MKRLSCTVVVFLTGLSVLSAADQQPVKSAADLKTILSRRVIDPNLPLVEVQTFSESRVIRMPRVSSVAEWEKHAKAIREKTLKTVVFRGAAAKWRDAKTRVQWQETIEGGKGYRIRKLRFEAIPGLWVPALLYEPTKLTGKVPVVLNVNGHDGKGKVAKYKQIRCINQAKRGMLALNVEWFGMGQLRHSGFVHYRLNQIDLCGSSGVAPFFLAMKRGIDILLSHKHADPKRVAVAGLSGGGWQTIFISSLDTRVTLSNPVAGYSSFRTRARITPDLGDSEQTPVDLAAVGDYALLTAIRAPKPTLLTNNANDNCCFKAEHALPPLVEAAAPIYSLYGKSANLQTHVNHVPGTHNFALDNRQALYRMIGEHFFAGKPFNTKEIPSDSEVKTKQQLDVALPEKNLDFHKIAMQLAKTLPSVDITGETPSALRRQQAAGRKRLAKILRLKRSAIHTIREKSERHGDLNVTYWWLRVGGEWTVPGTEIVRGKPKATVIVLADAGRATTSATVQRLLDAGNRVLAIDPFYFGESKIAKRDFLYGLLVSSVGERPLGVQAGQITAIAGWLKKREPRTPVSVTAIGPRTSLIALCAAGLDEKTIDKLDLHQSFASLKEILEQDISVNQKPELFCFGLLKEFDVRQLATLVAPRPVRFHNAKARHRKELGGLKSAYKTLGKAFDPLR